MQKTGVSRLARPHFDWPLCLSAYLLALFGVLAVSITNFNPALGTDRSLLQYVTDSYNGGWQAIFMLVTPLVLGGMMFISYKAMGRMWPMLYGISCVLLVAVLFTQAFANVSGWFSIMWDRTIQPAEIIKVVIIISLSSELSRHEKAVPNAKYFLRILLHIGVPSVLIMAQPDIGTMLVFIVIFFTLLLISGCSLKLWFGLLIGGGFACIPIGMYLQNKNDFRWLRLVSFLDPEHDPTGSAFQITNSKIAVGAGGLNGVGMFKDGTLTHLNFVPENHTDFILSSIGETMGFIGCMVLLGLYAFMLGRMFLLAFNTPDRFGRLIIMGVASMQLFHVFENVGMNIGVMPITGIPLPFISYGGSNLIANMGGIGLVLNVTRYKQGARRR
jgi:rod shape determining protein RodA